MNEKPGLEPGFFCSTSCWRLDGLCVAPGAEHMLGVPLRGWFSEGLETSGNDGRQAQRSLQCCSRDAGGKHHQVVGDWWK
jgi:hypothetical protein